MSRNNWREAFIRTLRKLLRQPDPNRPEIESYCDWQPMVFQAKPQARHESTEIEGTIESFCDPAPIVEIRPRLPDENKP